MLRPTLRFGGLSKAAVLTSTTRSMAETSAAAATAAAPPVVKANPMLTLQRTPKWASAHDAVQQVIKSGMNVYVHAVSASPTPILTALSEYAPGKLKDVNLYHLHLYGPAPWAAPEFQGIIRSNCLQISRNLRQAVNEGRADNLSVFLSEIPQVFSRRLIDLDVAIVQTSPPDQKGFVSLGTNVDCSLAAVQCAKKTIALCNPKMPRTFGDGVIHSSHFDWLVYTDFPLHEYNIGPVSESDKKIGELIATKLVEDGATLHMGIGHIPQATLPFLRSHRSLGIHTENFTDNLIDLIEAGVVTNSEKTVLPGKVTATMCTGTRRLFDYVHDNPLFEFRSADFTNDASAVIHLNPKVTSINTAIEIDLTGQVVADSIGKQFYSGFAGQIDFMRGAERCLDGRGKPIIALQSVTNTGESKIVPVIKHGAGVVTTRAHIHYVVTEFGVADLFGKNLRQRAYELITISHPNHREALEKAAFDRLKVMPSP